jgi:hypothetical protein
MQMISDIAPQLALAGISIDESEPTTEGRHFTVTIDLSKALTFAAMFGLQADGQDDVIAKAKELDGMCLHVNPGPMAEDPTPINVRVTIGHG